MDGLICTRAPGMAPLMGWLLAGLWMSGALMGCSSSSGDPVKVPTEGQPAPVKGAPAKAEAPPPSAQPESQKEPVDLTGVSQTALNPDLAPPCEASGARLAPCTSGEGVCLFVVDNEISQLYEYAISPAGLTLNAGATRQVAQDKKGKPAVDDLEALVRLGDGWLLMGSHSHNKRCERKKRRGTLYHARAGQDPARDTWARRKAKSCKALAISEEGEHSAAVCALIKARAKAAKPIGDAFEADEERIEKTKFETPEDRQAEINEAEKRAAEACAPLPPPLNLEGAARLGDAPSAPLVIGMRSPVLPGQGAVLVHLDATWADEEKPLSSRPMTLLDLGPHGVRELLWHKGHLYVIAGPEADASSPFELYRFKGPIQPGAGPLKGQHLATLPTSTEGLAIDAHDRLWFLVDDNHDKALGKCVAQTEGGERKSPARYYTAELKDLVGEQAPSP